MPSIADKPTIYEINTRVWLTALSRRYHKTITLGNVPDEALNEIQRVGCNTVWMMGVWQRSPDARRSALNYTHEYRPALPDMTDADVTGSPYAIYRYEVDSEMGGRRGLASLRARLAERGMSLMLDFVPNHMATDAPLIHNFPNAFVQATPGDYRRDDFGIFRTKDGWGRTLYVCRGRDPYFPAWIDTAQINAFSTDARELMIEILLDIAEQCDGVRCDMAMLMTNSVFEQTWSYYIHERAGSEYWRDIIPAIKDHYPDFVFAAEVYWDMEYDLQQQGFDYTYDKRLYDRIVEGDPEKIRVHLLADIAYQSKMIRFLENHDEPRAADTLGVERQVPAAVLNFTLPGGMLLFDGQLTGSQVKLPVQLGRAPDEPVNEGLKIFYHKLFADLNAPVYTDGEWRLFDINPARPDDTTNYNLIAHGWRIPQRGDYRLIVVNLSPQLSEGIIRLDAWHRIQDDSWQLLDVVSDDVWERNGIDMIKGGLPIRLHGYDFHVFRFEALPRPEPAIESDDTPDDPFSESAVINGDAARVESRTNGHHNP